MIAITIIGMGMSGNASFCQIVNQLIPEKQQSGLEITIHIFEATKDYFATGAAHRIDSPFNASGKALTALTEELNILQQNCIN